MATARTSDQTLACHSNGFAGPSPDLCVMCQRLVDDLDGWNNPDYRPISFYEDTSLMYSNAENGCLLCGQILGLIEINAKNDPDSVDHVALKNRLAVV
jgi:hypothetical protein